MTKQIYVVHMYEFCISIKLVHLILQLFISIAKDMASIKYLYDLKMSLKVNKLL